MYISTTVSEPDFAEETAPAVHERSWLFGLMIAPTGALANGLVQGGALAYLLSTQGIGSGGQSHLIALLGIPTWLYFVWSPITDFFVRFNATSGAESRAFEAPMGERAISRQKRGWWIQPVETVRVRTLKLEIGQPSK